MYVNVYYILHGVIIMYVYRTLDSKCSGIFCVHGDIVAERPCTYTS